MTASEHISSAMQVIKKYPNRRLYDTKTSSYITLSDIKQMVLEAQKFVVLDAKTDADITRSILLQIILEEETAGMPMFSTAMLSHIIRFYGHAMQGLMGRYLESNLESFMGYQQRLAEQSKGLYDPGALVPEVWTQWLEQSQDMLKKFPSPFQSGNVSFFSPFSMTSPKDKS
jgi:polyhydroxyalkanoate synthesis repressor PhaR